jgi:fumarate reductase flavoprotein subunit
VRAGALETTIASYNEQCATGHDATWFKPPDGLRPVRTPPFHAVRIRPAIVCWTGTGLRIDREARVLDASERPIAGLYAAGETTGGVFGECYAAGGASIANAIVFGRVAGAGAAALVNRPSGSSAAARSST